MTASARFKIIFKNLTLFLLMWHKTDAVSALFRCGTRQMQSQPYLKIQVQIMLFAIIFKTMLTDGSLSPTPVEIEYKLLKKGGLHL